MNKVVFLAGMLSATVSFAQELNFEEKANALGLPATTAGSLAHGTINGKKAVLITGSINNLLPATKLYLYNTSTKVFEEDKNVKLQGVKQGQAIFIDIDQDGDEDIALIGSRFDKPYFRIYDNNNGAFTEKQNLDTEGLDFASIDSGDYNNDGDIDILVTGMNKTGKNTFIYDNTNGTFAKNTTIRFTGIQQGDAKFIDTNKDGKLDVVLSGIRDIYGEVQVYTQAEDGTFKRTWRDEDNGYESANIAVGEVRGTGYQDFVVIGRGYTDGSLIYTNEGADAESEEFRFIEDGFALPNLAPSSGKNAITIADLDSDGKNDIVFASGEQGENPSIFIYKNVINGGFAEDYVKYEALDIPFGVNGSVLAFDYDNDGDLDLFVTGEDNQSEPKAKFFENKKTTLSNKEVATKASVELYPNPVSNEFRLKGIDKVSQISIYDMSGRLVKTFASQPQYDISGLAKGNYIVLVKGDTTHQFKIVKK